jgi:hypothetical protein
VIKVDPSLLLSEMWQQVDATDRVYQGVMSVVVHLRKPDGDQEILTEMFVAPTPIVRAFAEFLCHREEEEAFEVKRTEVKFQDLSVSCGDSSQAVHAYECLKHYHMPLSNYSICAELASNNEREWGADSNFKRFKTWYLESWSAPTSA